MNYELLQDMNERQLKNFLSYISDCLTRIRRFNHLAHMRDLWMIGKKKAEARLDILNAKKQMA